MFLLQIRHRRSSGVNLSSYHRLKVKSYTETPEWQNLHLEEGAATSMEGSYKEDIPERANHFTVCVRTLNEENREDTGSDEGDLSSERRAKSRPTLIRQAANIRTASSSPSRIETSQDQQLTTQPLDEKPNVD